MKSHMSILRQHNRLMQVEIADLLEIKFSHDNKELSDMAKSMDEHLSFELLRILEIRCEDLRKELEKFSDQIK